MGKLFDMESPIMRFLSRMGDLLILNFIVMICCIPIITVGASFTAMHYVLLKMIRDEEGYLVRGFFKSFARNFKQATLIWMLMLLVIAVFVGDTFIFKYSGVAFPQALILMVRALVIIFVMVSIYIFPVLARFDNTIKNTIRNAALFSIAHLPRTVLMMVFYALPFVIGYISEYTYVFIFMFGISAPAYGAARLYSSMFKKYEPESETVSDLDFSLNIESGEEEINGESE